MPFEKSRFHDVSISPRNELLFFKSHLRQNSVYRRLSGWNAEHNAPAFPSQYRNIFSRISSPSSKSGAIGIKTNKFSSSSGAKNRQF
jgi:hypothetical protein